MGWAPTKNSLERMYGQPKVIGVYLGLGHATVRFEHRNPTDAGDGQFIGTIAAVNQPSALRAKLLKGLRHWQD